MNNKAREFGFRAFFLDFEKKLQKKFGRFKNTPYLCTRKTERVLF
jgi:hypothetical protein